MAPNGTNVDTLFTTANGYSAAVQASLGQSTFAGLSTIPGEKGLLFNSPDDVALGQRVIPSLTPKTLQTLLAGDARFQTGDASGATQAYSANLVLPNVLSFQIQVNAGTGFGDLPVDQLAESRRDTHFSTRPCSATRPTPITSRSRASRSPCRFSIMLRGNRGR